MTMAHPSKELRALAEQLQKIKKQAEDLGVFSGNRELLECPNCDLQEDVLIDGALIVVKKSSPEVDTGLRFIELEDEDRVLCPLCRKEMPITPL